MISSVVTGEIEERNQLNPNSGPNASSKKRKQHSPHVVCCPDCQRAVGPGRGIDSHADGCLFVKHFPRGVKVRGVKVGESDDYLPAARTNYMVNAIQVFNVHRIAVSEHREVCTYCSSADDAMADGNGDEADSSDLNLSARAKKRRSYDCVSVIGDAEKIRLDSSGVSGYLNHSILTKALECICKRAVSNVRAVPTNYYLTGTGDRDDMLGIYMESKIWPEKLLIPVNADANHWCMFVVEKATSSIEFWDSLDCSEHKFVLLKEQLIRRLNYGGGEQWSIDSITRREGLPKQIDSFNCGVMLLLRGIYCRQYEFCWDANCTSRSLFGSKEYLVCCFGHG